MLFSVFLWKHIHLNKIKISKLVNYKKNASLKLLNVDSVFVNQSCWQRLLKSKEKFCVWGPIPPKKSWRYGTTGFPWAVSNDKKGLRIIPCRMWALASSRTFNQWKVHIPKITTSHLPLLCNGGNPFSTFGCCRWGEKINMPENHTKSCRCTDWKWICIQVDYTHYWGTNY